MYVGSDIGLFNNEVIFVALTSKQEKFVQNILVGMTQRQAYKDAYNTTYSDKTTDEMACKLFNSDKVYARYQELLKKSEDEAIMNAVARKKWLTEVINGKVKNVTYGSEGQEYQNEAYISDKLKAIDILNKMDSIYQKNINLSGNVTNKEKDKNAINDVVTQMKSLSEDDI